MFPAQCPSLERTRQQMAAYSEKNVLHIRNSTISNVIVHNQTNTVLKTVSAALQKGGKHEKKNFYKHSCSK